MDPHRGAQYRTPSPGNPLQQGYQLEDSSYAQPPRLTPGPPGQHQRFATPSDHLNLNSAVSRPASAPVPAPAPAADP